MCQTRPAEITVRINTNASVTDQLHKSESMNMNFSFATVLWEEG